MPPAERATARERLATLDLVDDDILEAVPAERPRGPLERVREAVGELEYLATPWQAASICAQALANVLRARAVLVHQYDRKKRELRIIAVQTNGPHDLLGDVAKADDDLVASTVIANGKPMTLRFDGALPRVAPRRLRTVGAKSSLVAVPGVAAGGCLSLVEVVDGDGPVAAAADFAASQLARFLGRRAR